MNLAPGTYGIWQPGVLTTTAMAAEIERLGYGALWLGGPPEDLELVEELLDATRSLVIGSSIVNIWQTDPAVVAASYYRLTERFPGRFVLGVGAGHPEFSQTYQRPMDAIRQYLATLDEQGVSADQRVLAALGPKMLALAATRAGGAIPYLVTPEHTRIARQTMGPAAFLAPEQKVVLDADPERAREIARPRVRWPYLGLSNYTNNLRRLGFTDDDLAGSGSDRLIDALVAHGDASTIKDKLGEHLAAGADHVVIQVATARHSSYPDLPDVELQIYDDEVVEVYATLAAKLF
jgi:probable F420-dependent oxidoreductase